MLLKENNASHILELKTNNANSDDTYHTEDSFHFVERRAVNGNKWLHTYLKAFRVLNTYLHIQDPGKLFQLSIITCCLDVWSRLPTRWSSGKCWPVLAGDPSRWLGKSIGRGC